jgi:uncharacterized protein (DUF2062 family)
MVVGVDAAATGNYGQDITIAIVIAIVVIGAAVPLSVLLEECCVVCFEIKRRSSDARTKEASQTWP